MKRKEGVNIGIRSPIGTNAQNVSYIKAIGRMWMGSNLAAETQGELANLGDEH